MSRTFRKKDYQAKNNTSWDKQFNRKFDRPVVYGLRYSRREMEFSEVEFLQNKAAIHNDSGTWKEVNPRKWERNLEERQSRREWKEQLEHSDIEEIMLTPFNRRREWWWNT